MSDAPHPPENITLAELLRAEPMRAVQMHALAGLDRVVDEVRLVDDVEQVRAARPGSLIVLQHGVAQTAWSTTIAVRYAWERNVRAVICELDAASAPSVISLAERLSVPLGLHEGNLPALALALSAIVAYPEASRARLVARCAELVARQREVDAILGIVETEFPGVRVTLRASPRDGDPATSSAHEPSIRVPMGPLDLRSGRELLGEMERGSVAWAGTVRAVLEIARAQIIACEAAAHVKLAQRRQLEEWTLRQLLDESGGSGSALTGNGAFRAVTTAPESPPTEALIAAERLGWRVGPGVVAGSILPLDASAEVDVELDLALAASWPEGLDVAGPIRHGAGWGIWLNFDSKKDSPEQSLAAERRAARSLLSHLLRCLDEVAVGRAMVGGVGNPVGRGELSVSLRQAELAARVARRDTGVRALSFGQVGASAFLAAAEGPALHQLASDTLAPLVSVEDGLTLARTLAIYLDCGGSTGRAAELLAVHRNTVSARIDRVRRLGLDLEDPATRLGVHMAAHLLGH